MSTFIVCVIALAVAMGIAWLHIRTRKQAMKIHDRPILDNDTLYSRHYAESDIPRALVSELWHEVANALKVAPGLLRPDDQFGKDIGVSTFTSEDLDYLGQLALKRAKIAGRSIDLQAIKTVDDYVRTLSQIHS